MSCNSYFIDEGNQGSDRGDNVPNIRSLVGSEFVATTPVFLSQVQWLGRLPVPQWYDWWLLSRVGVIDCSKGQSSLFFPLAQNLLLDVLVEQETGRLLWGLSCKTYGQVWL